MSISFGEKHQYVQFNAETFNSEQINAIAAEAVAHAQDVIIDLSAIGEPPMQLVEEFLVCISPLLDENIIILVGDEEKLEKQGFLADEFPVTPTYSEALDFLYMLQLEKDLGIDEWNLKSPYWEAARPYPP